jgi:hypothetical protein
MEVRHVFKLILFPSQATNIPTSNSGLINQ